MKNEQLNEYANRIEAAGLKRDADITDLHHYVIAVEFNPNDCKDLFDGMPDAFEGCFDRHNPNTGKEESICMFYLEDCTETDASTIESWLKSHTGWKTYEFIEEPKEK